MTPGTQIVDLDQFLAAIYEPGTTLDSLLRSLGFDAAQVSTVRERHLPTIVEGFIQVVRKRLTWEDKDLWFRILARRFGLDGNPSATLETAAQALNIDLPYASYAEGEALQKCRTKTALQDFRKELHRLTLGELSKGGEKPGKQQVTAKLDRLADLRAATDVARMDYEAKRAEVLKQVQAELDALDAEFQPALEAAEANASALEAEIRNDVLLRGESLSGGVYQAIYMKGRISWDGKGIDHYARSHPDVLQFRKEGQPSVSLRIVPNPATDGRR